MNRIVISSARHSEVKQLVFADNETKVLSVRNVLTIKQFTITITAMVVLPATVT